MLDTTVTIEPYSTGDEYGVASYGTAVTYAARVESRSRWIAGIAGAEIAARGRVYLGTTTIPSVKDRLTLPSGYTPSQPPILEAYPVTDGGRTAFVVLY